VREATEGSLRRLGVDALDLTQLHCLPRTLMERGEVFECLRRLQREGKVQHFGASVETVEEGLLCTRVEGLASLQVIFNVLRQKPAAELFEEARRRGVAIIVRLPLASGLLGGHLRADTTFPKNDHRRYNRDGRSFNVGETFAGLPFAKGVELAETLRPLVPPGMTSAQFALRWCLDHDAVTTVIPGAKRPQQARENAEASGLPPLAPALHDELRAFYRERVEAHIRGPY
jgi:aryl-alcohol dehydrogenase-like predicted oxidoreductase